jgi:hypothetical protein
MSLNLHVKKAVIPVSGVIAFFSVGIAFSNESLINKYYIMQRINFNSISGIMMLAVLSTFMLIGFQSCSKDDGDGDRTDMLCHTWKARLTEEDKDDGVIELTLTFSKDGKLVAYDRYYSWSGSISEDYEYATWKWNNKEQTEIYTRYEYEGEVDEDVVTVRELTNKSLKIMWDEEDGILELYR